MKPTRNQTAERLIGVTMLLIRDLAAAMRRGDLGLTPMHVGLMSKIEGGETNLSELARHLAVRLPTVSKSITLLVDRGWIERWTPAHNRRQTLVRLTADGARVLADIKRESRNHVAGMLNDLTPDERRLVDSALGCLSRTLTNQMTKTSQKETTA